MSATCCPNCQASTSRKLEVSMVASVNYYRCPSCSHVWTTDKLTGQVLISVTAQKSSQADDTSGPLKPAAGKT